MRKFILILNAALIVLSLPLHAATDFTQTRTELLDILPSQPAEPLTLELRELIKAAKSKPKDVDLALQLAHLYYQQAVREGELRFVGYARNVLSPWWNMKTPPIEVQVMRADLRQYVHDFNAAANDLTAVLARKPD